MKRYIPKDIEPKWQKIWAESKIYEATEDPSKEKKYIAGMFPYPSGAGLHVGHVRNYSIVDVIARFHRQRGYNVMTPMGWDTFGLPAENYAIKTGTPPAESTAQNIKSFKNQFLRLGMSIDWSRELNTTDPEYYRWTQWIFTQLFKKGLAYQAERMQWWCPHDKTVLANEQVEAGKCWRCGNEVIKKSMKQWFFKITQYADELLENIDDLDWPEGIKAQQRNWIGKSVGAEVDFKIASSDKTLSIFTTRPDTLYGATFMVLAPEHELVNELTTSEQQDAVQTYIKETLKKSEIERQDTAREKTGVFTGSYAINPVNNQEIPIWIADYVLTGYGTGAIMAVPAHDERDNAFAKKFDLPIVEVIEPVTGIPRENPEFRRSIVAIVRNPKDNTYLSINWGKELGGNLFVGGGREEDEDIEACAKREIAEETGYQNVKFVARTGRIHHHYHAFSKNKDRIIEAYGLLFDLVDDTKQEQILEQDEEGKFTTEWISQVEAEAKVTEELHATVYRLLVKGEGYHGEGILTNSEKYNGVSSALAREQIVADLEKDGVGHEQVNYRMRDWLISRQRYWGAPIPIIHCEKDGAVAVPEDQLPVILPEVENYEPDGTGTTALGRATEWVNTTCPSCGGPAKRETDTMDGYACSSWYYLRYADPKNDKQAWDPTKANYWMPIDYYCGGDHAVSHLLYSRFWTKAFADMGLVDVREPVKRLVYNGYINAPDGFKMSKSKGNVVDPLELVDAGYGADALRVYELFIAPYDLDAAWDPNGIAGTYRFLNRVWNLTQEYLASDKSGEAPLVSVHKTIKKVSDDLNRLSFNTAIAAQMELVNDLYKAKEAGMQDDSWKFALTSLVQLVAPFAPHVADELWQQLGNEGSVHTAQWPLWDDSLLVEDTMTLAVQVNGKVRGEITVSKDASQEDILAAAQANDKVAGFIGDAPIKKSIYVPGRLVSFVV
jgi:leucyl-tRNA synthetase